MADLVVVNPLVPDGVAPNSQAAAVAGDRFAATQGRKYLMRIANGAGAPITVTIADPTSGAGVVGASTPQDPDVEVEVPNGAQRAHLVDASRHASSTGWVNLTYSSHTSVTVEIYGPL